MNPVNKLRAYSYTVHFKLLKFLKTEKALSIGQRRNENLSKDLEQHHSRSPYCNKTGTIGIM
jgi:hypothetical protein